MSDVLSVRVAEHLSPRRQRDPGSWRTFAFQAIGTVLILALALWLSTQLHLGPALHHVALFAHLSSLVLGFGAVLVADYLVATWLFGRYSFAETIAAVGRLHAPIWLGLAGLIASGTLLEPNLAATATRIKLALVLIVAVNGLQTQVLARRMALVATPGRALLLWGTGTALLSHLCWWGAMGIGFWTTRS